MTISEFFASEKIEYYSVLPATAAVIKNPRRAEPVKDYKTVIVFAVPYLTDLPEDRNVARFAVPRDYHLYAKGLFERFSALYPDAVGFCDDSPVDEKTLALRAGIGVRGMNSLIINPRYGSYILIGEIFVKEALDWSPVLEPQTCDGCRVCVEACPVGLDFSKCLARVTQSKKLTPEEEKAISDADCKWGCDICQEVCPMNRRAMRSPIPFFSKDLIPKLDPALADEMARSGEFDERAYSWRGVGTVKRNLEL